MFCRLGKMGWPTGFENVFAIFDKSAKTPHNLANKGGSAFFNFHPENLF